MAYLPFGSVLFEEHSSSFSSPYLFNGKELDRETGLSFYGARYYDNKYDIWLNVDKKAEKFQNYGSYIYAFNNPVRFVDPDGNEPDDIVFRGKDNKEVRIKTAGEDKIVNLPFNVGKNKTIDVGIGNVDPNRFVYGYTVQADISLAAVGGAQWGGEVSVARFTDNNYSGYNYVYAGGHINKTVGAQVSIGASIGGSIFFGYNDSKVPINPSTFSGDSYTLNASMDIKAIVGGGIGVGAFSSVKNPLKNKGWKGFTLGFNVGVGGGGNMGSIGFQHSTTTLVNDIKATSERSFADRITNTVAPIPASIVRVTYNALNP